MKKHLAAGFIAVALLSGGLFAGGDSDAPVVITSPSAWATLRSDSISVSIQADTSKLPRKSIDFKVVRRSGSRSTALFTKNVKMGDVGVDAFLGRVRPSDIPLGGGDFLSIEWSVPGSEAKGVIEPLGIAKLAGAVSEENKWVSAQAPIPAVRIRDGAAGEQIADVLAGAHGFEVGGMKFAAGWNGEGLFIRFVPVDGVTEVEFAFDLKCGKSAFLAWADRFIVYAAASDSVSGLRYGNRSVDKDGLKQDEARWGGGSALSITTAEAARVITVSWHELGIQPFDERNIGFSVFVKGRAKQPANYPSAAKRNIPGTWGDVRLEK